MALAEHALRNQVPETSFLARSARERGAVAASAFGAGFGGAVWAMVRTADAEAFVDDWRTAYLTRFPHRAEHALWLVTRPGEAARAQST
jgi:galactokinase